MTELEKLVQTWERYKPIGTPHEHIWNGFIDDAKAAIEREKQALSIANVVGQSEQLVCEYCNEDAKPTCCDICLEGMVNAVQKAN